MPIKLPATLPAYDVLTREGVMVMSEDQAARQDIRPLRIGLLNLMPKKIQTETQFARLIGATPLQIEFSLIRMTDHETKNTAAQHMESFYRPFEEVEATGEKFDGLIITGAPIEHLPFEDVTYWDELTRVFDWTQSHVQSTFGVCWGGMAMIHHFHGVKKHMLDAKLFGCFRHMNLAQESPYLRGFSDDLVMPVSRWTEMRRDEIEAAGLPILLHSDEVGPALVEDPEHRALYVFNHFEYDSGTLNEEYQRDLKSVQVEGAEISVPVNYFPGDDPTQRPPNRWRSHAHLLYGNWINEIYQSTPYDMNAIGA
ncbi:homoserine O-succinyltransferase [Ponticoccus sp. SC2-23]|uniref:homoserine O-succinyltransferase n=1 Tax=Alexandriicola marinus TaxID=2081710 RepID=UPI000FDA045C|nr:homoserine O-succinyltransferase [Alexandriicola marinus]MBM1218801.1 homoserine O-succinyltransferase [Ponticoccus sp. SC6-9]MBM1224127.1 homoserine O-succinyltransferase [Ponticoccus sp. SC6-15]MBM1230094.1 homoserine O-succinyltransferase [Ponticoccus sp. SC6-38]MBM1233093.1 homoserine O-succinyltransferase [Ponticoccus sp. SC6-45]MBM1236957.1 homoserine O-succinyltransferase [Ponticoccus sp. SC6-49]MBM1242104.1 homoserine O-succinyltransferase [Ponticoccus sp. SC2-64]MBM1246617.1 homo